MERSTPSRRDGMNLPKEESLLWEATLLVKNAADSLPTLQLYVPSTCGAKGAACLTLSNYTLEGLPIIIYLQEDTKLVGRP